MTHRSPSSLSASFLLLSLLTACGNTATGDGTRGKTADTAADKTGDTPAASASATVSASLLDAVCAHEPCGGDPSMVTVYRDGEGRIAKLYRLYGTCSHSPALYFQPDGTVADTIAEKPVTPGSPEAAAFQARHDKQVKGLTAAEELRCSDRSRGASK